MKYKVFYVVLATVSVLGILSGYFDYMAVIREGKTLLNTNISYFLEIGCLFLVPFLAVGWGKYKHKFLGLGFFFFLMMIGVEYFFHSVYYSVKPIVFYVSLIASYLAGLIVFEVVNYEK